MAHVRVADRRARRGDRGRARRDAGGAPRRRSAHPSRQRHGLASDPDLVAQLGLSQSSYEGPTGIVGVLQGACQAAGLPSASLWAAVPHYIAASPNPKAALALVRKLEGLVSVVVDASELEDAASAYDLQVNAAVQSDPDVQAFVERLEQASATDSEVDDLPSGDSIARDLQQFLAQRDEDQQPPGGA